MISNSETAADSIVPKFKCIEFPIYDIIPMKETKKYCKNMVITIALNGVYLAVMYSEIPIFISKSYRAFVCASVCHTFPQLVEKVIPLDPINEAIDEITQNKTYTLDTIKI